MSEPSMLALLTLKHHRTHGYRGRLHFARALVSVDIRKRHRCMLRLRDTRWTQIVSGSCMSTGVQPQGFATAAPWFCVEQIASKTMNEHLLRLLSPRRIAGFNNECFAGTWQL